MGTVFSLLFLLVAYLWQGVDLTSVQELFPTVALVVGVAFLVAVGVTHALLLIPLQRAEDRGASRSLQLLQGDVSFHFARWVLLVFPLFSFACALRLFGVEFFSMASWFVFLGASLDAFFFLLKRVLRYVDPFTAVQIFVKRAKKVFSKDDTEPLHRWYDALSEVSSVALNQSKVTLANHALQAMEEVSCQYVNQFHLEEGILGEERREELHYTLLFFLQRYEHIFQKVLDERLELPASQVIFSLGNLTKSLIYRDMPSATLSLYFLGMAADATQEADLEEVAIKATITLQQLANVLIDDSQLAIHGVIDLFEAILQHIHDEAKETFRQDKTTNLDLLTQPFRELKKRIEAPEEGSRHPDALKMVQVIDAILAEFAALEAVLQKMPKIPGLEEEEEEFKEVLMGALEEGESEDE